MATNSSVSLPYDYHIDVASNEFFLRATINRNLEKLLKNDILLASKIEEYGTGSEFSIECWKYSRIYNKGDAVVYIEFNSNKTEILNLYLLRCIRDNNTEEPSYEIVDNFIREFKKSGWEDTNPLFALYNSTDKKINLSTFIDYSISNKFYLSHEADIEYHKFGELSSTAELSSKILLNDMSNIADNHIGPKFAYEVFLINENNLCGVGKKWGNGVIEYDLTFSLNGTSHIEKEISENGEIIDKIFYKVNSFVPLSNDLINNDDYFLSAADYNIFTIKGNKAIYEVNGIEQANVSHVVNTYHGSIVFPIPFIDTNYMIYVSNSTKNMSGKSQSPNTITFANRQKESITAIYVIPNYSNLDKIEEVLLENNLFQCQIIGKWKK